MLRNTSKGLILCGLALAVATASAQDVSDIVKQAEQIKQNAAHYLEGFNPAGPGLSDEVLKLAEEIVKDSNTTARQAIPQALKQFDVEMPDPKSAMPTGEWVDILVSRSMGPELEQTIRDLEGSKVPVRFVFRGIAEGQRINDAFADYGRWTSGLDNPPAAALDPTVFRKQGATTVPQMIYMKDGEALASVRGLSNPQWLADAVKRGERGDLGTRGPVMEIAERDLIEVMKERVAGLDLESRRDESVATYWDRARFTRLAPAVENRRRTIDPTVVVHRALTDTKGNVLVPAGTHINPLQQRPFTLRLVVFNPNRKAEVEWVTQLPPVSGLEDMYIASEFDRQDGWKQLETLENRLGAPVFMLPSDVASRFELQRTPTLVTAENLQFVVEEFVAKEEAGDAR